MIHTDEEAIPSIGCTPPTRADLNAKARDAVARVTRWRYREQEKKRLMAEGLSGQELCDELANLMTIYRVLES